MIESFRGVKTMATPNEQYIDALREHGLWSGPTPSIYKKPKESNKLQTRPINMKQKEDLEIFEILKNRFEKEIKSALSYKYNSNFDNLMKRCSDRCYEVYDCFPDTHPDLDKIYNAPFEKHKRCKFCNMKQFLKKLLDPKTTVLTIYNSYRQRSLDIKDNLFYRITNLIMVHPGLREIHFDNVCNGNQTALAYVLENTRLRKVTFNNCKLTKIDAIITELSKNKTRELENLNLNDNALFAVTNKMEFTDSYEGGDIVRAGIDYIMVPDTEKRDNNKKLLDEYYDTMKKYGLEKVVISTENNEINPW